MLNSLKSLPKLLWIPVLMLALAPLRLAADVTSLGISCSPCTGNPGDTINVTVNWTTGNTWDRAFMLVAFTENTGQTTISSCPVAGQTFVVYETVSGGSSTMAPTGNGFNPGADGSGSRNFTVTVPALNTGTSYNLVATAGNYWVQCNANVAQSANTSFTVPAAPPSFSVTPRVDNSVAVKGGLSLIYIDYTFINSTVCTINTWVPTNSTLVALSPGGVSGGINPGDGLSWNLGSTTGVMTGSVWLLVRIDPAATSSTLFGLDALGDTFELSTVLSSTVYVTLGSSPILTKSYAPVAIANLGDTITYTLAWNQGSTGLQVFDSYNTGAVLSGTDGATYTILPESGSSGNWNMVADPQGGQYLAADGSGRYPVALRNANLGYCQDYTVSGDMLVDTSQTGGQGQDAHVVLRHDGVAGGSSHSYMLGISADATPAKFFIQKNNAGPPVYAGALGGGSYSNGVTINQGQWYSVKAEVLSDPSGLRIRARIWTRGSAEPGSWSIDWTDTSPLVCTGSAQYVGWQADNGLDLYDNLRVTSAALPTNQRVYDTIPTGITYASCGQGCVPPGGVHGPMVWWDLPTLLSGGSGTLDWSGTVSVCADQQNQAGMDSDEPAAEVLSNTVNLLVAACNSPTPTPTLTPAPQCYHLSAADGTNFNADDDVRLSLIRPDGSIASVLAYQPTSGAAIVPFDVQALAGWKIRFEYWDDYLAIPSNGCLHNGMRIVNPCGGAVLDQLAAAGGTWPDSYCSYRSTSPYVYEYTLPAITCACGPATATPTLTVTPSITPTSTPSATLTFSNTVTPSATPSWTQTPSPSETLTATPSTTPLPTLTITPSPTITVTPVPTAGPLYLRLYPPNPGPAHERAWLPYHLSTAATVDFQVWTLAGEPVRSWNAGFKSAGAQEELWDLRNQGGIGVSSGIFIYRIRARSLAGEEDAQFGKCAVTH